MMTGLRTAPARLVLPALMLMMIAMLGGTAWAKAEKSVSVEGAWSLPGQKGHHSLAVYMTISNTTDVDDRLIAASSPVADQVELIVYRKVKGGRRMAATDAIAVDTHAPVIFDRGGPHLRLEGLKQRIVAGASYPVTLTFEHAGTREITVKVRKAAPGDGMPTIPRDVKVN